MQTWRALMMLIPVLMNAGAQAADAKPRPEASSGPGVKCPSRPDGGAAPPEILSAEDAQTLQRLLRPYQARDLDAQSARQLKQSLCEAGLWQQAAAQRAMAEAGFKVKQIEQLAPSLADEARASRSAKPASAPRVPPRE